MGSLMIIILSSGYILWQNAFLQSPCLRVLQSFSTTMLVIKRNESSQKTGAYLSDLVQMQSLWLPNATILDLALIVLNISSFLVVRTHIKGIAQDAPFARRARYYVCVLRLYAWLFFSETVQPNAMIRVWGVQSNVKWTQAFTLKVLSVTKFVEGDGNRGHMKDDDWWPGRSIPSTQRSCQVVGKLGILTPQSSFLLLMWCL